MIGGLIGVVHLPPLPGDPRYAGRGGFPGVERRALADAEALATGGAEGIVLECFGSAPFPKGTAGDRTQPHQVAALAILARACSERFGLPVGVNCLRSDAVSAIGIAAAAGAGFVRVNVHVGAYVTDQGLIEGEAAVTLRYRRSLEGDRVAILADVLVKHAAPLAPLDPEQATLEALDRGLADGVIVTGEATGAPVDAALVAQVRGAAGERAVLLGSGVTPATPGEVLALADGAIVGTWLKRDGDVRAPIDEARVRELADALRGRFREPEAVD